MLSDPFQEDRPAFRAVIADEDIGEQNDGEGLCGVTEAVNRLIHKSSENSQLFTTQEADHCKADQPREIGKDVFDRPETFLISIVLEFCCFLCEFVAQLSIIQGL